MIRARLAVVVALLALTACGGKVVFQSGEDDNSGGAGGGEPGFECVGTCGDPCTKCVGNDCFSGYCSDDGFCNPPEQPPACPAG